MVERVQRTRTTVLATCPAEKLGAVGGGPRDTARHLLEIVEVEICFGSVSSRLACPLSTTMADPAQQRQRRIVVLISGSGLLFHLASASFVLTPPNEQNGFASRQGRICRRSSTRKI